MFTIDDRKRVLVAKPTFEMGVVQQALYQYSNINGVQHADLQTVFDRLHEDAVFHLDPEKVYEWILTHESALDAARLIGHFSHAYVNHRYDQHPYGVHLDMASDALEDFMPGERMDKEVEISRLAVRIHDIIEDARLTYNDIAKLFGHDVAEVVFLVSNNRGRNRKERANDEYYSLIRVNNMATAAKLADRIGNMRYGYTKRDSGPLKMYIKEMPAFRDALYRSGRFEKAWDILNALCQGPA